MPVTAHRTGERGNDYRPRIGKAFVHTVIDDHSRVAYAEICTDEKAATAIGVLQRAVAWFAEHGVTVERVLSDNGAPTGPTPGVTPAPNCASPTSGPARTGPRPTAKSNDSTEPWPTAGLTPGSTINRTARRRAAGLAALLQSPPSPLRHRRPATSHQTDQPPWTSQLVHVTAEMLGRRQPIGPNIPTPSIGVRNRRTDRIFDIEVVKFIHRGQEIELIITRMNGFMVFPLTQESYYFAEQTPGINSAVHQWVRSHSQSPAIS